MAQEDQYSCSCSSSGAHECLIHMSWQSANSGREVSPKIRDDRLMLVQDQQSYWNSSSGDHEHLHISL